jgi:exo-1,4-beta-D-glucosaminidase
VSNVYGIEGKVLDHQTASGVSVGGQGVARNVLHPTVPAATTPSAPAKTYFVELLLERHGKVIDRNVYWLSTQPDVVNWDKTIGNPQATMTQFANLGQLQSLPAAAVRVRADSESVGGGLEKTVVRITNTSRQPTVAFFLRADVRRGSRSGAPAPGDNEVLPIFWSDNDVTIWPGESETLRATYRRADLHGASPVVSVSAQNSPLQDVPAS